MTTLKGEGEFFVNFLVLRAAINGGPSVWLGSVRKKMIGTPRFSPLKCQAQVTSRRVGVAVSSPKCLTELADVASDLAKYLFRWR